MPNESEHREVKSVFAGTPREWLRLVKTIVAMANTRGGRIYLDTLSIKPSGLDPAKVDDKVNRHVSPRIDDITVDFDVTEGKEKYATRVNVPHSPKQPHITVLEGQYSDDLGRHHWEFRVGQVWVRHGASNATATGDDLERMFTSRASTLLGQLGALVAKTPLSVIRDASREGLGVTVTDSETAPSVNIVYRYTATELGREFGKPPHWIGKMVNYLGWRSPTDHDKRYVQRVPGVSGNAIQWRYSESAKEQLAQFLETNPEFNPYQPNLDKG